MLRNAIDGNPGIMLSVLNEVLSLNAQESSTDVLRMSLKIPQ